MLRGLGAVELPVDVLPLEEALELLAKWARRPADQLPPIAADVAEACGRLPLGVAMAGAMVRGRPAGQ